ncbi:MAG: peptidoglycan-binding domain-containing protein [Saprospiraceae bacterium]
MSTTTLRLGKVDQGFAPADTTSFFMKFHAVLSAALQEKLAFRDEGDGRWRPLEEVPGTPVSDLQRFLKAAGFMPHSEVDGIYGYVTHAAVRLFQEYVRTVDNDPSIGTPDGIAGPNTFRHIEDWKEKKEGTPDFVCKWAQSSPTNGSAEFNQWIGLLEKAKSHYLVHPHPILQFLENFPKKSDTKKIRDWDTSPDTIHLIGIRRNEDVRELKRENDDLFVLLINGMVFKFWGSTDPSQSMAFDFIKKQGRLDEAFLTEGQHLYKFGWHKVSDGRRVYRAMKPAQHGVLVFRDRIDANALTEENIQKGLDDATNFSINIHWSGKGQSNYSAGCQVIAGKSYINPDGQVIDCSAFASDGYDDLDRNKTRGAYNVLTDLILNYSAKGVTTAVYTLARDETFFLSDEIDEKVIEGWVERMRKV